MWIDQNLCYQSPIKGKDNQQTENVYKEENEDYLTDEWAQPQRF